MGQIDNGLPFRRAKLLDSIYKQMMEVKVYRKRHRKVRDIDPESGKIVVDESNILLTAEPLEDPPHSY